jgi:hypothetical protein
MSYRLIQMLRKVTTSFTLADLNTMFNTPPSGGGASSLADLGVTATAAELNQFAGVKRYVALLSQSGTDAPVATVRENTLSGVPARLRDEPGSYALYLAGEFPAGKTVVFWNDRQGAVVEVSSPDYILINTGGDDLITGMSIEISVYP